MSVCLFSVNLLPWRIWLVVKRFSLQPAEITGGLCDQDLDSFWWKQNFIIYFCHSVEINASLIPFTLPERSSSFIRDVCYHYLVEQCSLSLCLVNMFTVIPVVNYWNLNALHFKIKWHFSKNNFFYSFKATVRLCVSANMWLYWDTCYS